MPDKPLARRIREHPRFWLSVGILFGLIIGNLFFQWFTGFSTVSLLTGRRPVDQTIVNIESADQLNLPPILIVPQGSVVLNATYNVAVNGLYTVYMWVIQFSNNTIHPTPIIEPAYVYWQLVNPLQPTLSAIYVRFHFFSRLVYGGWTLNGTRVFISYSPTFYIPTIGTGLIASLLKPKNGTIVSNYTPLLDPNIPYSTLPSTTPQYTPDPWQVLNSPQTILNGILFGIISGASSGLVGYGLILVTVHPEAPKKRIRIRKDVLERVLEA